MNASQRNLTRREASGSRERQWPTWAWFRFAPVTLAFAFLAALLVANPWLAAQCELDRLALADQQCWRIVTGHLTHWNVDHAVWDVAMFLALGILCERRWPWRFAICLPVAALAISAAVLVLEPSLNHYRGLSGVDSALFTLAVGSLLRGALSERRRLSAVLLTAALAGFATKVFYEYAAGATLFVDSTTAFTPIPLAHVVGGVVGLVAAFAPIYDSLLGSVIQRPSRADSSTAAVQS